MKIQIPKDLYNLSVIERAVFIFSDHYKTSIGLDSEGFYTVDLINIDNDSIDASSLEKEFLDMLNTESIRDKFSERSIALKELIVARALFGATHQVHEDDNNDDFEDPEGIAIPWEEKYGDVK